jgi:hypothetical protein
MASLGTCVLIRMKLGADEFQTAIQEIRDRRKRLCSALFVHACIAIEKLPKGSDFWSEAHRIFGRENLIRRLKQLERLSRSLEHEPQHLSSTKLT